jgi:hypothetical protein
MDLIVEGFRYKMDWMVLHSASSGQTGGLSFTWIPPRFFSAESWNGSLQPPSLSGVASHNLIKCLLGFGGAWSLYSVRAWRTCSLLRNWISPTSRIMWSLNRWHVSSNTFAASICSALSFGIMPASMKRPRDFT